MSQGEEQYTVDEIISHELIQYLIAKKHDFPYDTDELKKSRSKYAFLVSWVGYEGNNTWQSYESFDDHQLPKNYARREGLELFDRKESHLSDTEALKRRVREIEEAEKAHVSSAPSNSIKSSHPCPQKKNDSKAVKIDDEDKDKKKIHKINEKKRPIKQKDEAIDWSSEDESDKKRKGKKKEEVKADLDVDQVSDASSSLIFEVENVKGLQIHCSSTEKKKYQNGGEVSNQEKGRDKTANVVEKKMNDKGEHKKKSTRSLGEKAKEESGSAKKKRDHKAVKNDDESDDDVSPNKKKRESKEDVNKTNKRKPRKEASKEPENRKSNDRKSPRDSKYASQKGKREESSDESSSGSSDESDGEWELDKIVTHVKVTDVKEGRDIEGREDLDWDLIKKSQLPMIFRVQFKDVTSHEWTNKKFEWMTIEEMDDLPELNRYAAKAALHLPKGYASMLKKKKISYGDDDLFQA